MIQSKYFKESEFTCKCGCGKAEMDQEFIEVLDTLRANVGRPFIITSGYRCPEYNKKVSTTGEHGPHTTGKAVDIKILDSSFRYALIKHSLFITSPIYRLGVGNTFVHVDMLTEDEGFSEEVIWIY